METGQGNRAPLVEARLLAEVAASRGSARMKVSKVKQKQGHRSTVFFNNTIGHSHGHSAWHCLQQGLG